MFRVLKAIIFSSFLLISKATFSQEAQVSLMDEISYVFLEKLIAVAKENYPRVKANNSRIESAKARLSIARTSWISPFSISYVYSPSNTLNITNPTFFSGYQLAFSLNFANLLQTPGNIKTAKEDLNIARLDNEEYLLSLSTTVKSRYFNYIRSLKALKVATTAASSSLTFLTMIKYKFEKGEAAFDQYNTAATSYSTNTQAKINAEVEVLTTKVELEELLGIKIEEVPN